mmetsp:Transcript_19719/g.36327  ORF Transcript_19719/g.36327 Transcript_19719/m.36327 type:complete len:491 (-) Transcript_19719:6025-7497(-)
MQKNVQLAIEKATSETLIHPDLQLNMQCVELINYRPDVPKEAIKVLKRRLLSRNPKVQLLTIELLDLAVDNCSLPLHNQVASKDFTSAISQLARNRETPQLTREKLAGLVQKWALKFDHSQDVLPGFNELYQSLKAAGMQFPPEPPGSRRQHFSEEPQPYSSSSSLSAPSVERRSLPSSKVEKLKKDLGVVEENIQLTNEIIDASDPRDDATRNDILCQLVATLRAMESKLVKLISGVDDDELLNISIEMKDKVDFTLKRFEDLRHGRKPEANRLGYKSNPSPPKVEKEFNPYIEPYQEPKPSPYVESKQAFPDLMGVDLVTGPSPQVPFDPFADLPAAKPQSTAFASQILFPSSSTPQASISPVVPQPTVPLPQPVVAPQTVPTQPYQTAPAAFSGFPQGFQYDPMKAMFGSSVPFQSFTPSPYTTMTPQSYQGQQPQGFAPQVPQSYPSQASAEVKVKHNMGYVQEERKEEPQKPKEEFHDLFSLEKI